CRDEQYSDYERGPREAGLHEHDDGERRKQQVENGDVHNDLRVATAGLDEPLVGVQPVSDVPGLAVKDSSEQSRGCIDDEDEQQDHPHIGADGGGFVSGECNGGECESEKATSDVAHEYPGRHAVPDQESSAGARKSRRDKRQAVGVTEQEDDRAGRADDNRLDGGDPVNAVHEIVEIDEPCYRDDGEDTRNGSGDDAEVSEAYVLDTAKPDDRPGTGAEVGDSAPAGADVVSIVEPAHECY